MGEAIRRPPRRGGAGACQIVSRCLLHPQIFQHPSHNSPLDISKSFICRFLTPPFSSPGARAFRQAPQKNRAPGVFLEIKIQRKFGYVLGAVLGRKSGQHGSNLAPKMEPKSAKNREKIDAKIDRKIDAFQDRFLMRFWWILGAKLEPSWDPNRRKMKVNFESPFLQKKNIGVQKTFG